MEVRAIAKYIRVQPRKVRIVADEVRGKLAVHSAALLRYHPSKSAFLLRKVLVSAIANAAENHGLSPESLTIRAITIDEGPRMKRMTQKAMGRGNRIIKKTSHITVIVEDQQVQGKPKPHGTKAKPRPKFEAPKAKRARAKAAEPEAAGPAPVEAEAPVEAGAPETVENQSNLETQADEAGDASELAPVEQGAPEANDETSSDMSDQATPESSEKEEES